MPFVGREGGSIARISKLRKANCTEFLPVDDAELVALRQAALNRNTPAERMRRTIVNDPFRKAVVKLMAEDRGITRPQMVQLLVDQLQP